MPSVLKGPSLILRFNNSLGKSDLFKTVGPTCTISYFSRFSFKLHIFFNFRNSIIVNFRESRFCVKMVVSSAN